MENTIPASPLARLVFCAALLFTFRVSADVVETKNGTRLIGRVISIKNMTVTLSTDYAGEIKVKQDKVISVTTDNPVAVKFEDGSVVVGTLSVTPTNRQKITNPKKSVEFALNTIRSSWAAGEEDPDVVARRRKWSYEAGADINGRNGTHTQTGEALTYRAKLAGPDDTFQYYANYVRQTTDSQVAADQFKAGVDYASNFTPLSSWYARDEGGFDRVHDIAFYDVMAAGYGYDLLKQKDQTLTGRTGLSYRYETYTASDTPALSTAGADVELDYSGSFRSSHLHDKIAFVPAFKDLSNYLITHDISYEVPITRSLWKLAVGMTNTFYNRPVDDVARLETLYYTRLVLSWGEGARH